MSYIPVNIEKSIKNECQRRRLSPRTAETYLYCINKFLKWSKKEVKYVSKKDVRLFLEYLSSKDMSGSTMNTYHMAVRFLFEQILRKKMWINIKYSKTPKKLPIVLTKEEVKKLLNSIKNLKHKLMITFLYSAGLRVSELTNLKVKDLELEKGHGFVRNGKGRKDRLIIISKKIIPTFERIIDLEELKEEDCLFRTNRNKGYSTRSIQEIIKKACKKAGIKKKCHPHTLRHSFATHLIENGYSLTEVQSLLGHKSPETTMIYVHIANPKLLNIKSPLDSL